MKRVAIFLVMLLVVSLGVPITVLGQAASPTVSAQDDVFSPPMTHLSPGGGLSWRNDGVEQHTITADDDSFDSGVLDPGQTFQLTFDTPGTYPYYCLLHGGPNGDGMAGVVVVS